MQRRHHALDIEHWKMENIISFSNWAAIRHHHFYKIFKKLQDKLHSKIQIITY